MFTKEDSQKRRILVIIRKNDLSYGYMSTPSINGHLSFHNRIIERIEMAKEMEVMHGLSNIASTHQG